MKVLLTDEKLIEEKNKRPVIYEIDVDSFTDKRIKKGEKFSIGQKTFVKVYDAIWNYIFIDYKRKDNFIKVIFRSSKNVNEKKFTYMMVSEFLMHMIFWRIHAQYAPLLKKKVYITEDFFYDLSIFDAKLLKNILENDVNNFIEEAQERPDGINEISYFCSLMIDDFMELVSSYSAIASNTISLYEIHQLEKRSKVFASCINTQLDESKPVSEIEEQLKIGKQMVIKSILDDGKSALAMYIKARRMSEDQFAQMFYAVGPRTDVDKTILPKIMKGNFLKGYSSPSDAYIDAIAGRDAQILKHITVRDSGYLSRKINLSNLNTRINYNIQDCGTTHYLDYYVADDDFLRSIDLKYMLDDKGKLRLVHYKTDKALIGKTIKLRSHIFCACKKNEVCMTCFGGKAKRLVGTNIGGLPSIKLANPISNRLMKAKHFTTTSSMDVSNDLISKWFNVETGKMYFKNDVVNPKNKRDIYVVVPRDYVEDVIEGAADLDDDTIDATIPLESFVVQYGPNPEDRDTIECEGMFLVLTDEVLEHNRSFILEYDSDEALIPVAKIADDIPIFSMIVITEAVSLYLKKIKRIIDSSYTREFTDPSKLLKNILEILLNMGISGTSVINIETLIYQLIRIPDKLYDRPDFSKEKVYFVIIPLSSSIQKSDIYTAFSFEKFKQQVTDIDTFKKSGNGIFDPLFKVKKPEHLIPVDKKLIQAALVAN
ncbi:MAG: hypothetical protein IJ772_05585 [Bacilli bacterium]|nr:hypothetical protein [Bacilli bacterium]